MRYLHAVGLAEKLLSSGVYVGADGVPVEAWSIHVLPDGAWLVRVDRVGRGMLVEGWRAPDDEGGHIERIDAFRLSTPTVRATLQRGDEAGALEHGRGVGRQGRQQATLDAAPDSVLALPGILGAGLALAQMDGAADVLSLDDDCHVLRLPADFSAGAEGAVRWGAATITRGADGIPTRYTDDDGAYHLTDYMAGASLL